MSKILNFFLIFSVFFLLIFGYSHEITALTQDLGRHLKTGEIIVNTLNVPKINLYSYTYPDFPFINHHWFSEVIFFLIFKLSGYIGLFILSLISIFFAFALIFFFSLKGKVNMLALSASSMLYLWILFERTDIRPEIFSFLFLSLFIVILYKYRERFTKLIFALPLIELFWVNIHIYFLIGLSVIALFVLERLIRRKKLVEYSTIILIFVLIASALVTFINPNGINGAFYPLRVFNNYGYSIEENQNIFFLESLFSKPTIPYFKLTVVILFLTLIINFKKTKLIDFFLAVFFTILGVTAVRNFPLFVFGTFIAFSQGLSYFSERIFLTIKSSKRLLIIKTVCGIILLTLVLVETLNIPHFQNRGYGIQKGAEDGVNFFLKNNLTGPIFNNFDIGSYLDYTLYPKEKVFVDGRPEAYPSSFFQNIYIPMQNDQKVFTDYSKQYNLNAVFFSHTDQTPWGRNFIKGISKNKEWKIVYLDDYIIVLLKNSKENQKIINKFEIKEENFKFEYEKLNLSSLYRFLNVFYLLEWKKEEIKIYQAILLKDQNSCFALGNLTRNLLNENNPAANIYLIRYNNCR